MAQHGSPTLVAGAATNSPRTARPEPRRASKPQYTQTKKEPLGEGSFAKVRPVEFPAICHHARERCSAVVHTPVALDAELR